MIINPLFIKPENLGCTGEPAKSKFSNSSYLFSDIIKIVGDQSDGQVSDTVNKPVPVITLSKELPFEPENKNYGFTNMTLQAVTEMVSGILKQNGIKSSDDPQNSQLLANNINKLASEGLGFRINLTINNKNINIDINPEIKNYYGSTVTNSINPITKKTNSPVQIIEGIISDPILLSNNDTSRKALEIDSKDAKINNTEKSADKEKITPKSLNTDEESIISSNSTQINIIQQNPQIPEIINTVYALNSAVIEPVSENITNDNQKESELSGNLGDNSKINLTDLQSESNISSKVQKPLIKQENFTGTKAENQGNSGSSPIPLIKIDKPGENETSSIMSSNSEKSVDSLNNDISIINPGDTILPEWKSQNISNQDVLRKNNIPTTNELSQKNVPVINIIPQHNNDGIKLSIKVTYPTDNKVQFKSDIYSADKAVLNRIENKLPEVQLNPPKQQNQNIFGEDVNSILSRKANNADGFAFRAASETAPGIIPENPVSTPNYNYKSIPDVSPLLNSNIPEISINANEPAISIVVQNNNISNGSTGTENNSMLLKETVNDSQNEKLASPINNTDFDKIVRSVGNSKLVSDSSTSGDNYPIEMSSSEITGKINFLSISDITQNYVPGKATEPLVASVNSIKESVDSELNNNSTEKIPESIKPNVINSSGKSISNIDLNRIAVPDLHFNNADKVYKVNVEITENLNNPKQLQLTTADIYKQSNPGNINISKEYSSDFNFHKNFEKINNVTSSLDYYNDEGILQNNQKAEFIKQQIQDFGKDPLVTQNNIPLEVISLHESKAKEAKSIKFTKTFNKDITIQSRSDNSNPDKKVKHYFTRNMSEEPLLKHEVGANVSPSVQRKVANKDDELQNIISKNGLNDSSNNSSGKTVIENKSSKDDRVETPNNVDLPKSNIISIDSDEISKATIVKNNSDSLSGKITDSSIQNIAPERGIEISEKGIIKNLTSMAGDTTQPEIMKVKAEDLMKEIHKVLTHNDSQKVILNLHPENLGNVKIEFDIKEKSLDAKISVETESAKNLVQTNSEALKNSLQESGITLNSLNVLLSDGPRQQHVPIIKKKFQKNQMIETHADPVQSKRRILGYNTYEYLA